MVLLPKHLRGGILDHGFKLLDIWRYHSVENTTNSKILKLLHMSEAEAGLEWEWKHVVCDFLHIMTFLMTVGHYVQI